jgi:hypothetical protein
MKMKVEVLLLAGFADEFDGGGAASLGPTVV